MNDLFTVKVSRILGCTEDGGRLGETGEIW
jgi:hypothetical protein